MTKNQIDYANYKENARHNLVTEGEVYRHNYAGETELHRSNVAVETESHRHNLVTESIGWQTARAQTISANASMKQANVAEYLAPSQREMNLTQADLNRKRASNVEADTVLKGAQTDKTTAETNKIKTEQAKAKAEILKIMSETELNKIKRAVESVELKYRASKLQSEIRKLDMDAFRSGTEGVSNLFNMFSTLLGLNNGGGELANSLMMLLL